MSDNATLVTRLRNRREMVNYGNGDVRDIPDEDCEEAATRIAELEAEVASLTATTMEVCAQIADGAHRGDTAAIRIRARIAAIRARPAS